MSSLVACLTSLEGRDALLRHQEKVQTFGTGFGAVLSIEVLDLGLFYPSGFGTGFGGNFSDGTGFGGDLSDLDRFSLAFERSEQGVTPCEGSIVLRVD